MNESGFDLSCGGAPVGDAAETAGLSWDSRALREWCAMIEGQVAEARIECRRVASDCETIKQALYLGPPSPQGGSVATDAPCAPQLIEFVKCAVVDCVGKLLLSAVDDVAKDSTACITRLHQQLSETTARQSQAVEALQKRMKKLHAAQSRLGTELAGSIEQAVAQGQRQIRIVEAARLMKSNAFLNRREAFSRWLSWCRQKRTKQLLRRSTASMCMLTEKGHMRHRFLSWLVHAQARMILRRRLRQIFTRVDPETRRARTALGAWMRFAWARKTTRLQARVDEVTTATEIKFEAIRTAELKSQLSHMMTATVAGRRRVAFSTWRSLVSKRKQRRQLLATAEILLGMTHKTQLRSVFVSWSRRAAQIRDFRRRAKFALALMTKDRSKAVLVERFGKWRAYSDSLRRSSQMGKVRQLAPIFNKWHAKSAASRNRSRRRAEIAGLIQGGLLAAGARAINPLLLSTFGRWKVHCAYHSRMTSKCEDLTKIRRRTKLLGVFAHWHRRFERRRGKQDVVTRIATLKSELEGVSLAWRELNRTSVATTTRLDQLIASGLRKDLDERERRNDHLRRIAVLKSIADPRGQLNQSSFHDDPAARIVTSLRDLQQPLAEAERWKKPTVPVGPMLTEASSRYCECCFDKGGEHHHGNSAAFIQGETLCRKRFVVVCRALTAMQEWVLDVESRMQIS